MEQDVFVEWEDRYSVGIPMIDEQHKELIRLTNELYKGCLAGEETARAYFMTAVKGTVDYVKYHFGMEEKLLQNVKYPELAEHKREHEAFVKNILEEVQSFKEGKKFVPNIFVRYLKDWILSHIAVADRRYAAYILNLKKQGALNVAIGIQ
ncbi:MAG: bacteriohemerythrin [Treponema sp.]|jgi:hemerythrin|nr:bacteriohemerythrin [Treponema sp.]